MNNLVRVRWYQKQWGGSVMTFVTTCEENKIEESFEYFKNEAVFKWEIA
jgi:hypothetical protein